QERFWIALANPGKKLTSGDELMLKDGTKTTVIDKLPDGTIQLDFQRSPDEVFSIADRVGEIPVPPYVRKQPEHESQYQTIYAKELGSVAAPTAGFHFTPALFEALASKGIQKAFVTLHVGLGTFRPMKTETVEAHKMHSEWFSIPKETQDLIEQTKKSGHRVIAVGTTAVRALESSALTATFSGFTSLFITPGYSFRVIDGLMTNFHLPKSTLLVLVSAFAGREGMLDAYQHAIDSGYRFYSFGDAMLIL
ncbi:MAG TPA: tRNA preQ1(34) S-adenosylmethionine ribosyltransferase-isomerase QueA, partial [Patescibacteria group bacterium]|nr:tRNA preQ1(34) S-adenosylmethionine ribosyltransferase-isomerase QueA [Patescibacteria group bacterium]